MSDLERALRAAFALDAGAAAGPGFEARMVRASRARGGTRVAPIALAALVAGAAVATLVVGRGGEEPARVALRPAAPTAAAPAARGAGRSSFTEVWELVIRFSRTWSAADDAAVEDEAPPPSRDRRRRRVSVPDQPTIDCGDDPLCPLVAPNAARLRMAVDHGWGRVSIDGQDAGITPLDVEVIPGRHRVTIRFADGATRTMSVDLRSGEHRTLMMSDREPPR
ncbi:MAG TPA: PEGA domain-containing protein [Kofleriaceae bacterium]|jgi:hypothetical protein